MKAIEFGGGENPRFHPNYDIRNLPNVDNVIDINNLNDNNSLPIPSEEYDLAYSRYLLEHISWRTAENFLREIYRILKPDGKIEITTSNLLEQAKVLVNTKEWNNDLIGMIFGGQDFNENFHKCGFSSQYITKILTEIGFDNIKITPINSDFGPTDMIIEAIKPIVKPAQQTNIQPTIRQEMTNIKTIQSNIDRRQWVLQHCKIGEKILDVGSADGWIFKETPFWNSVTFVDLDIYDIPNFRQMDAHHLEFPDKSFDTVILGEILEHVENPVQVMKEANRVGKRILMTIPDEINWSPENYPFETIEQGMKRRNLTLKEIVKISNPNAKELYDKDNHKHLFHNRYYSEDSLIHDLENAGITTYEMIRLQYGNPQWSFFVVETKYTEPINKSPIITQPKKELIITQGPIPIIRNEISELKKDKLRIALISTPFFKVPPDFYGGLEQVVFDLAMGLDELGHEVTIFGPKGSKSTPHGKLFEMCESHNTVNVDWFELERYNYEKYKDIIDPKIYDVVIDNTWFGFPYLLKRKCPNLNIIHLHHGGYNWETPPPFQKPNLVSISKYMKQYTENYFIKLGYNVVSEYVYNPIDLDKYPFNPDKRTDRLLFVGRLSTFKQPHVAVEVAKKSKHKIDLIGGTFVDSDEYVIQLVNMVKNDPDVTLYKDVAHDFKIEKMQNAKALLFPSRMGEPFGLVACESMACGTPVIALNDGAISEIVIHNKTGFICNSVDEMIQSVSKVHEIEPENCRQRAEEFSRLKIAKEYEKLCYRVINNDSW